MAAEQGEGLMHAQDEREDYEDANDEAHSQETSVSIVSLELAESRFCFAPVACIVVHLPSPSSILTHALLCA